MERNVIVFLVIALWTSSYIACGISSSCDGCLFLTPYIKSGKAKLAREFSVVPSEQYFGLKSYSGYITVKEEFNSHLYFWFFPAERGELSERPWVIWLQGGPGFSSMTGLFDIIGPLKIKEGKVNRRNVTWASDYSVLFLDNPVGAGFSFTEDERGYPNNEDDVGAQMLVFLYQFLEMFPELRRAPLFIAGESYGGKYVPALAIQIHRHRYQNNVNLRGISIGNGLIDPRSMMHYSHLCRALGILDEAQLHRLKALEDSVVQLIDKKMMIEAAFKFNETIEYIKKNSGVSVYNFNEDPSSSAPEFEAYVTKPEVRMIIHAGDATFDYNNQLVYTKMLADIANTTKPFVEELLEHYGVMSYSGQLDIILAYSLSKHLYRKLQWSRRVDYVSAERQRLRMSDNGAVVAYKKSGGNFGEVLIRRAGHMVPLDQPEVAKFIMDLFIDEYK